MDLRYSGGGKGSMSKGVDRCNAQANLKNRRYVLSFVSKHFEVWVPHTLRCELFAGLTLVVPPRYRKTRAAAEVEHTPLLYAFGRKIDSFLSGRSMSFARGERDGQDGTSPRCFCAPKVGAGTVSVK